MKVLALLLLTGCGCTSIPMETHNTLRLEFAQGLCTGTAVGQVTILTAAHCVADNPLVSVDDVETHAVHIVRDGHDHALVTVDRVIGGHVPRRARPVVGERVHWTGNPNRLHNIYRQGYIAGIEDGMILVDAKSFGGDSGAGVFNDRGELVYVHTGTLTAEHGGYVFALAFGYPLNFTENDWRAVQ